MNKYILPVLCTVVLVLAGLAIRSTVVPNEVAPTTVVTLYVYNPVLDQGPGGSQCTEKGLVALERTIPQTTTPLADVVRLLLLDDITDKERSSGIQSEFPLSGVTLVSAAIKNGVATLTFSDPENMTGGGSCKVSILRAQIEATAKQFEGVQSVQILPEELFQP